MMGVDSEWTPDDKLNNLHRSVPERFLILRLPRRALLWDLASNHPPNPPTTHATFEDARSHAEALGDRPATGAECVCGAKS